MFFFPSFSSGRETSRTHNESLCDEENFSDNTWVTQGRYDASEPTPYPIIGEYTGVIPDTDGLCAKLYSDCNNPEIMFYTIFNCFNRSEVYEEREYRCLGAWNEDGLIYTFTQRRDMVGMGHECFVGLVTAKGDLYLREAGTNCERGQEPLKYGMRLSQVSKCYAQVHNPRLRWHNRQQHHGSSGSGGHEGGQQTAQAQPSSGSRKKNAQALPSWKERELNGDGLYKTSAAAATAHVAAGGASMLALLLALVLAR